MTKRRRPDVDIQIGTLPSEGRQGLLHPPKDGRIEGTGLVLPGTEADETYRKKLSELPSSSGDLDNHSSASELDHPAGSVKRLHLEPAIRALLENFVQGDNKAYLKEGIEIDGSLDISGDVQVDGTISGSVDVNGDLVGRVFSTIVEKSSDYTITDDDGDYIEVDCSSDDVAITLPTASDNDGRTITVKHVGSSNSILLYGEGSDQIDGEDVFDLPDEGSIVSLRCNGTEWVWVGGHIRGSDTNGNYVVFSSGLQVCWGEVSCSVTSSAPNIFGSTAGTIYFSGTMRVFPRAFASSPKVWSSAGGGISAQSYSTSSTALFFRIWDNNSGTRVGHWVAIGEAG